MPDGRCQNHVEIDVRVLEAIHNNIGHVHDVRVLMNDINDDIHIYGLYKL